MVISTKVNNFSSENPSFMSFSKVALNVLVMGIVLSITGSILIGAVIGWTASAVLNVLRAAYTAYRAGSSITSAILGTTGYGWVAWFIINLAVSYGINYLMGSPPMLAY
jgi:hypothetical protein